MKKLIATAGVLMLLYVTAGYALASRTNEADMPASISQNAFEKGYRLGVSEECVAVFCDGELIARTDTRVSSLPKADQKRLEDGIRIYSVEELKTLLEDYCS